MLIVLAVFAAWQGYGRNLTAGSGSAQATGTSSTVASPSASGSFASAFKAPISYATALQYARQESVATPHLQGYSRDSQFGGWQHTIVPCVGMARLGITCCNGI
jgi:hypothetical protein